MGDTLKCTPCSSVQWRIHDAEGVWERGLTQNMLQSTRTRMQSLWRLTPTTFTESPDAWVAGERGLAQYMLQRTGAPMQSLWRLTPVTFTKSPDSDERTSEHVPPKRTTLCKMIGTRNRFPISCPGPW